MESRRMGDSSLVCSPIGFGTWEMGTTQYGHIDVAEAAEAVHYALDHGINLFDTAEAYGPGHSEILLGKALGNRRKDVVLVTKVGLVINDKGGITGLNATRDHILTATDGCLDRLGTDWIDLLFIHWPDHKTPAEETIGTLEELKTAGKIREYAVSNYDVEMMSACEQYGHLAANQVGYHLFDRRMEADVLPYCLENKIGFMAYGSLGYGLLTGSMSADTTFEDWDWRSKGKAFNIPLFEKEHLVTEIKVVDRLKALAGSFDKTVAQLAIAWVLSHPAVSVALVGVRKPSEISENIEAAGWELTPEIKTEIDKIFDEEGVSTYRDAEQILMPPALARNK